MLNCLQDVIFLGICFLLLYFFKIKLFSVVIVMYSITTMGVRIQEFSGTTQIYIIYKIIMSYPSVLNSLNKLLIIINMVDVQLSQSLKLQYILSSKMCRQPA